MGGDELSRGSRGVNAELTVMSALTVPVMDNCCGCGAPSSGDYKQIRASKPWARYFPIPAWARGHWSDSVPPDESGTVTASGSWAAFYGTLQGLAEYPEQLSISPHGWLTARQTMTLYCLQTVNLYQPDQYNVIQSITLMITRTTDRRDGAVVYQEIALSQDPVPSYISAWYPWLEYARSASWRLNDDGTTTLTGVQPSTYGGDYFEPTVLNDFTVPSNAFDLTAWDGTATETSVVAHVTGYNYFIDTSGTMSFIPLTNTMELDLLDPYHAGPPDAPSALDDARQMLLLVDWNNVPQGGAADVSYYRDYTTHAFHTSITYTPGGVIGEAWMYYAGAPSEAVANAAMFKVDNSDGSYKQAIESIQTPMVARTTSPPAADDSHWVGTGGSKTTLHPLAAAELTVTPVYSDGYLLPNTWGIVWLSTDMPAVITSTSDNTGSTSDNTGLTSD